MTLQARRVAGSPASARDGTGASVKRGGMANIDKCRRSTATLSRLLAAGSLGLIQQGRYVEAEPILCEYLAIRQKDQPDVWSTFNTRRQLGGSLLGQKKYAEAEPLLIVDYEGMKAREAKIPAQDKARLPEAGARIVKLYEAWGQPEKAAEWRRKLATPGDAKPPGPDPGPHP